MAMPALILAFTPVKQTLLCLVGNSHTTQFFSVSMIVGRRLGSPVNAWESNQPPAHGIHSPQHSTASSSNVSITATPTISPGVSVETQSLSSQQQQSQQQILSSSQPTIKATRRLGAKRNSRPLSMANVFDHTSLDTQIASSSSTQRRG